MGQKEITDLSSDPQVRSLIAAWVESIRAQRAGLEASPASIYGKILTICDGADQQTVHSAMREVVKTYIQ